MKDEFASFSFQITNGLLSCMKVNADIYCLHSASFQPPSKRALSLLKAGRRRFIKSVPGAFAHGSLSVGGLRGARTSSSASSGSSATVREGVSSRLHGNRPRYHLRKRNPAIQERLRSSGLSQDLFQLLDAAS